MNYGDAEPKRGKKVKVEGVEKAQRQNTQRIIKAQVHKSTRANEEKYRISNIEYRKTKCRPFRPWGGVGISIT